MDVLERFSTVFNHEEPDHVPSFVQGVMSLFQKQWLDAYEDDIDDEQVVLTPVKDVTLHCHLGFESSWCGINTPSQRWGERSREACRKVNEELDPALKAEGYSISQSGTLRKTTILPSGQPHGWMVEGTLDTEEKWEAFYEDYHVTDVDPQAVDLFDESMATALEHDHLLVPTVGLLMEPLISTVGVLGMGKFGRRKPKFFEKVLDTLMEYPLKRMEAICKTNAPIIVMPDDCAFKGRPTMSPAMYERFIIPRMEKMVKMAHGAGKKVFLHSDGFIEPYYPLFIKIGLDGHESLEPAAGMDLLHCKEEYGDDLVLIGNIDCSRLLPYGTPAEVVEATKKCLRDGAPGGGYVFSPCTDLTDSCRLDNVEAMMAAVQKYGAYPDVLDL
ncbi:MAG: uroporphyrinogen decarboxylase family protein [Promethearchaeota archaeon]